ncbi:Small nuclear ribonucleoprotein Sm D3 [Forsythia ovata]|uniref:Small nuclear ribonucleoprotein Sm D3 n=1 Tax=Forsythia ovata TaxID=205694 RepID=A0ABD1WGC4_9LAMI
MIRSLRVPVKLLHEASGHVVSVELKNGELYRGSMVECEDNWNCQLENITYTAKDGKVSQLEHIFIRGSKVRFMVIPDMLKNAPMFKRLEARIKGKGSALGVGRGRAVAMRARAQAAGRGAALGRGVVPPKPCLAIVTDNLPGTVVAKLESAALESNKIISSTQSLVKKCKLIVKLSNIIDPRSNEDPATNVSVASGTMASKVCPVCKTFSSSSNTTLNAYIDQCLSGESIIKWTANSRVTKHRIKPRKTRLMVDIYETTSYCTLEELDRRNGTNWALNLAFQPKILRLAQKREIKHHMLLILGTPIRKVRST